MRNATRVLLIGLVLAGAARADEAASWEGVWRIGGKQEHRTVSSSLDGTTSVTIDVDGQPVTCSGQNGATLSLTGWTSRTIGITGVLENRKGETGRRRVVLHVRRDGTSERDGREFAVANASIDGEQVLSETWIRQGAPRLKIVRTECSSGGAFAPKEGPMKVHVEVLGRPQRVTLEVIVDEKSRPEASSYYTRRCERDRGDLVVRKVHSEGELEVGPHILEWDGRDGTSDRRILLAGDYLLRARSGSVETSLGERRKESEKRILMAEPKAITLTPSLSDRRNDPNGSFALASSMGLGGYAMEQHSYGMPNEQFLETLEECAVMVINTQGAERGFVTSDGRGVAVNTIEEWRSQHFARTNTDDKPLKDVHAVFVFAAQAGKVDAVADPHSGLLTPETSLGEALQRAGVDVVVTFKGPIVTEEKTEFQGQLALDLMKEGMEVERAVRDSAARSREIWWEGKNLSWMAWAERRAFAATLRLQGVKAIEEVVDVQVAPGVNRAGQTLFPPRHGCSTN